MGKFRKSAYKGRLRTATKAFLIRPAKSRCQICGYDIYAGNLTFHHKIPKKKSFNISAAILTLPLTRLVAEASKCIVACHNCHGEIHAGIIAKRLIDAIPTLDYARYRLPTDIIKWYQKLRTR